MWSIPEFEEKRPELTSWLKSEIILSMKEGITKFVIRAPVKSGKRVMVEYLAIRDRGSKVTHFFVSAFHRVADEEQRNELKDYGLKVFSLINVQTIIELVESIVEEKKKKNRVVIHLDECDYGSGEKQLLSYFWDAIKDVKNLYIIMYSATPAEVHFSGGDSENCPVNVYDEFCFGEDTKAVTYVPPQTFCGPKKFLDEGLVMNAEPFSSDEDLGTQAKQIITDLKASTVSGSGRNILVLRLSGGKEKASKPIYKFIKNIRNFSELDDCIVCVDRGVHKFKPKELPSNVMLDDIRWSSETFWKMMCKDIPIIIVVDQTTGRSTEWVCHNRVFAYHDYRNNLTFSTVSQAQERVNHYITKYGDCFQPIKVYGFLKAWQLSAGTINYSQYLNVEWTKRLVNGTGLYKIRSVINSQIKHPQYNREDYSLYQAEEILSILGCNHDFVKLSTRIKGNCKELYEVTCEFVPCDENTFNIEGHRNPFLNAKKRMSPGDTYIPGNFRGVWKKFDYDEIVVQTYAGMTTTDSRLTICYRNSVLGVAHRKKTGQTKCINSLEAYNSMYV